MEIMRPIASTDIPENRDEFAYEVKYDGFRAVLYWERETVRLISRNNKDLTENFPEIIAFCLKNQTSIQSRLPLKLDGELVVLNNPYQANFPLIQRRGRLKNKGTIKKNAESRPAMFLAFDLLEQNGTDFTMKRYCDRKNELKKIFNTLEIDKSHTNRIGYIKAYEDPEELWEIIFAYKGEGMIAKRKKALYHFRKNHHDWFKIKNWRTIYGFLTCFHTKNGYFTVCVFDNGGEIREIGKCKHGLDSESFATLSRLFLSKGEKINNGYKLPPAICAAIHTLDFNKGELREPEFANLLPDVLPEDCTIGKLKLDLAMVPEKVSPTNTEKLFWPNKHISKGDLLVYIREISPYMLPYLRDRPLTVIRCPDGVNEEAFFQKSLPAYAPSFFKRVQTEDKNLIVCDRLESLIWLANHGALEYHIPFQQINKTQPIEIVFDLDPPSREQFNLAIQAATLIKHFMDDLRLSSFVKTSGNKGLQIHIPILEGSMTYAETAIFTEAIAMTLAREYPTLFTVERLKKNRGDRLYIDYIQHAKDKTLIAPYSPRKTGDATVATPLFWEEVKEGLTPDQFTIENAIERVQILGCPFADYFEQGKRQNLKKVLRLVK